MSTSDTQSGQAPPGEIMEDEIWQSEQKAGCAFQLLCYPRNFSGWEPIMLILCIFSYAFIILKHYSNGNKVFYSKNIPEILI